MKQWRRHSRNILLCMSYMFMELDIKCSKAQKEPFELIFKWIFSSEQVHELFDNGNLCLRFLIWFMFSSSWMSLSWSRPSDRKTSPSHPSLSSSFCLLLPYCPRGSTFTCFSTLERTRKWSSGDVSDCFYKCGREIHLCHSFFSGLLQALPLASRLSNHL